MRISMIDVRTGLVNSDRCTALTTSRGGPVCDGNIRDHPFAVQRGGELYLTALPSIRNCCRWRDTILGAFYWISHSRILCMKSPLCTFLDVSCTRCYPSFCSLVIIPIASADRFLLPATSFACMRCFIWCRFFVTRSVGCACHFLPSLLCSQSAQLQRLIPWTVHRCGVYEASRFGLRAQRIGEASHPGPARVSVQRADTTAAALSCSVSVPKWARDNQ